MHAQKSLKEFPQPMPFRKLIGPSFIILALGLGSGEVILWPYLASNYGLGIAWGAILGITFQFFMNMEIERYALVKGESVFVGISRLWRPAIYWFIFSTFISFGLPGIIAASAQVMAHVLGIATFKWVAIVMLLVIGLIISSGRTVYGLLERLTKIIILLGVPFIFILAVIISSKSGWLDLFKGIAGIGEGYRFFPAGISLATFLAAFAYAGAGGNLNLTQSIYVKEKGYGMGRYSQKIAGLFADIQQKQKIKLSGESFSIDKESVSRFRQWWRIINREHLLVFWFIGSISMLFLMLLAYSAVFGLPGNVQGINFVINEGLIIGSKIMPFVGTLFLVVVSLMLFQTQLGVLDSTSRIMAENYALKKLGRETEGVIDLSRIYFVFLWAQIAFGIALFLLNIHDPKTLIILAAVLNAFAMFVHVGLVFWMNHKVLSKEFRPAWWRKIIIGIIFVFFGFFSLSVLLDKLGLF